MTEPFSLGLKELLENPQLVFERSWADRGVCPVTDPAPCHAVIRSDDVRSILRDDETWQSRHGSGLAYARPNGVLVATDPPLHTEQRALAAPMFRPAAIAALEGRIRALADGLVTEVAERGRGDVINDIAVPLSMTVGCWTLGVATDRIPDFWSWVLALAEGLSYRNGALDRRVVHGYRAFYEYFGAHLTQRRADLDAGRPVPEDLLARLMTAERDGHRLGRSELLGFCQFMLVAGSSTTTLLIGNLVHRLVEHPTQLAMLREDRSLLPAAIEESLRFDAPLRGLFRTSQADQRIGDVDIPANGKVLALLSTANRDPKCWHEPDNFDITRDVASLRRHSSFGFGIHYCIGAPLARLLASAALTAVLDHLPGLRIDGEPRRVRAELLNGFEQLPVAWDVNR